MPGKLRICRGKSRCSAAEKAAAGKAIGKNSIKAACERAVFDLSGVRFMDSTGIGFLIGRYKRLRRYGIPAALQSVDFAADKVLAMSGIYALIPKL